MARIVICSGAGEPKFSTNYGIYRGFKGLGHDVLFVGPAYNGRAEADILLEDRAYPEIYTLDEVLEKLPWTPDLLLQVEPHFWLKGENTDRRMKTVFYVCDPHRGLASLMRGATWMNFDAILCAQRAYLSCFVGLPIPRHYMPFGFDDTRLNRSRETDPRCDIVFCGETGLAWLEYPYEDELGRYCTKPPDNLPTDHRRFANWANFSFDYAQRGQLLIELCKQFRVRIYDRTDDGSTYQRILQAGTIGFNRSLMGDLTFRPLEITACGRFLVTDRVDGQCAILPYAEQYESRLFHPLFENFLYGEAQECTAIIRDWLQRDTAREHFARQAKEHIWKTSTWKHRAQGVLDVVFN